VGELIKLVLSCQNDKVLAGNVIHSLSELNAFHREWQDVTFLHKLRNIFFREDGIDIRSKLINSFPPGLEDLDSVIFNLFLVEFSNCELLLGDSGGNILSLECHDNNVF
jgi:hypothetical protein